MKQFSRDKMSTIISTINFSIIYNFSKSIRFITELSSSLYEDEISYNATEKTIYLPLSFIYSGTGFEWALGDNLRLKLSILSNFFLFYLPYINLAFKFN